MQKRYPRLIAEDVDLHALGLAVLFHAPHTVLDVAQGFPDIVVVFFPPIGDPRHLKFVWIGRMFVTHVPLESF